MKVFLSWSGETSRAVACALRDWLPYVIQSVKPFVSTSDIEKGQRWSDVLSQELSSTAYGIICLTPFNVRSPWLNFEAGAISKTLEATSVSPFLFRVDVNRVEGPLQQFQATLCKKDDVLSLLGSMNKQQKPEEQLSEDLLGSEFDKWWPKLEEDLGKIKDSSRKETETGFPWMYVRDDLARIQATEACKQVWVITPNLYPYTLAPDAKDDLQRNLARGIQYTFITHVDEADVPGQALAQIAMQKSGLVKIRNIPEDEFKRLAATDYVIVNPDGTPSPPRVFLELPITQRGYWIEVDGLAAMNFVARFRELAIRDVQPPDNADRATASAG